MLTLTGLIFIPVGMVAMAAGLRAQLVTFAAGAVLSSAAVANLGSFGIQPAYFMGLLLLGVAGVLALMRGGYCLDRAVLVRLAPLAVLLLACLNALFWATAVFWDDVWVVSGRQMFDLSSAERYSFRSENLNQFAYLILNILLTLLLADRLVRLPVQALLKAAHTAVLGAFFVATLFVAWDWLAHSAGIYFPDAFLHSNAFYAVAHEQSFGDIARISGPFSEPSELAYAYGGFLAYTSGRALAADGAGGSGCVGGVDFHYCLRTAGAVGRGDAAGVAAVTADCRRRAKWGTQPSGGGRGGAAGGDRDGRLRAHASGRHPAHL